MLALIPSSLLLCGANPPLAQDNTSAAEPLKSQANTRAARNTLLAVHPTILEAPQSLSTYRGANVQFEVLVGGLPPMHYQWLRNGIELEGETNRVLSLSNVQFSDRAEYAVHVHNNYGSAISEPALLSVGSVAELGTPVGPLPLDLTNITAVAAGDWHNVALREDGTVVSWGSNSYGQTTVPEGLSNVVQIAAGGHFTLALKDDGTVVAWGIYAPVNPVPATVPAGLSNVVEIAAGSHHGLARTQDGRIVAWGYQNSMHSGLSNIVAIAAGSSYNLALLSDSSVLYWTSPEQTVTLLESNLLAIDGDFRPLILSADGTLWTMQPWLGLRPLSPAIDGLTSEPATNVVAMSAGRFWAALRRDGTIISDSPSPLPDDLRNVIAISSGENQALALIGDGRPTAQARTFPRTAFTGHHVTLNARVSGAAPLFYQWSHNGEPMAGATNALLHLENVTLTDSGPYTLVVSNTLGSITLTNATLHVTEAPPYFIEAPAGSEGYPGGPASFSVRANGSFPISYQWFFEGEPIPFATNAALELENISFAHEGSYHVEVTNAFGGMRSESVSLSIGPWIPLGQYADPYPHCVRVPAHAPPDASDIVAAAAGLYHGVGLRADGTVTTWGIADFCLPELAPLDLPEGLTNIVSVAAGHYHSLALRDDGTIVAWGDFGWDDLLMPPPLTNVVAIAARDLVSAALLADGRVAAWGYWSDVPADLTNAVAITVGSDTAFALTSAGTIVAFGRGTSYWAERNADLTNVVSVAAGHFHMAAVQADGTVTVRSRTAAFTATNAPPEATNILSVAAWRYATLALRADGTLISWGEAGNLPLPPSNLSHVVSVSAGDYHALARVDPAGPQPTHQNPIHLQSPSFQEGRFTLEFQTLPGRVYLLEQTGSLNEQNWTLTKPLILGDGTPKTLSTEPPASTQHYYRVRTVN